MNVARTLTPFIILLIITYGSGVQKASSDDYVIGVESIDYPPIWSIKNNHYSGFARELLDAFSQENNLSVSYRPLPVKRLWVEFISGKVDFKFPDNEAWAPDKKEGHPVYYSTLAMNYVDGILVKPKLVGGTRLNLKKLGIIRGFTPSTGIVSEGFEFFEASNMLQLFKLVEIGRIDGIYSNTLVGRHYLINSSYNTNFVLYDPALPSSKGSYKLSSIKHPALIDEFSQFLIEHKSEVDRIKLKYGIPLD